MGFLSPYLLWGAAAAGIPVVVHLFFRSRYRTVPWAAMKFLLTSIEQTSRRLRFQELLLLVVRSMLLAVLALALARPTATSPGEILLLVAAVFWNVLYIGVRATRPVVSGVVDAGVWLGVNAALAVAFLLIYPWGDARAQGGGRNVDAVFLFDTSYSMGASDGELSRFERAKRAAKRILDELPPHSTVRILTCADRVLDRFDEPMDSDRARQIIDELKLTQLGTDLAPAVAESADVVKRCKSTNKEFYLFSDMQKVGWERQPSVLADSLRAMRDEAAVNLVRCGSRMPSNVAIVAVTPQVDMPRPGERVPFNVRVRNTGTEAVGDIEVTLVVDGDDDKKEVQAISEIAAGESRTVTLSAKLDQAGLHVVTAAILHDDLPGDNRFDRVVRVRDRANVLVVDGGPNTPWPSQSSTYY